MTRDELVALLRERDALSAAAGLTMTDAVRVTRAGDPGDWLTDGDDERLVEEHRRAHREGRPSVATVTYGEGIDAQVTADRMLALAALATETGMLRAVCPVPAPGVRTPGSWGVEDLTVVAAARRVFDPSVRIRPSWERLGAQTCGVTLAFGADELMVPADERSDVAALAASVGRAVAGALTPPLRVGRIVALNMYPIYHHLEQTADPGLSFTDGLPAALNAAVLSGDLDVSAMSSIEYARNADRLELLPVASISAAGAVDSIQVFSRVPFDQIRSVAVTPHSATSVALLRILVGQAVTFTQLVTPASDALEESDAVLLIADEALHGLRDGLAPIHTDLGERWRDLTGLPMVFALWAARRDVASPEHLERLASLLRDARASFVADPDTVVAAAARRFPFPPDYIRGYFSRLGYAFGPDERAGLRRFLELARAAGELDSVPAFVA